MARVLPCWPAMTRLIWLVPLVLVGCGRDSVVYLDSFSRWCGAAPCGWNAAGNAVPAQNGALLGGLQPTTLTRSQAFDLSFAPDDKYPGHLVVLSQGPVLITVGWNGGQSVVDQLELLFTEPTYLYFFLEPPRTATSFSVSLITAPNETAWVGLVGVTRCAPAPIRQVGFNTVLYEGRVLSWHWVEAAQYGDRFGNECPSGGGGDDPGAGGAGD